MGAGHSGPAVLSQSQFVSPARGNAELPVSPKLLKPGADLALFVKSEAKDITAVSLRQGSRTADNCGPGAEKLIRS